MLPFLGCNTGFAVLMIITIYYYVLEYHVVEPTSGSYLFGANGLSWCCFTPGLPTAAVLQG